MGLLWNVLCWGKTPTEQWAQNAYLKATVNLHLFQQGSEGSHDTRLMQIWGSLLKNVTSYGVDKAFFINFDISNAQMTLNIKVNQYHFKTVSGGSQDTRMVWYKFGDPSSKT